MEESPLCDRTIRTDPDISRRTTGFGRSKDDLGNHGDTGLLNQLGRKAILLITHSEKVNLGPARAFIK